MEVYFNELSINPIANTLDEAREKVYTLLNVMKELRQYEIFIIRTYEGFYNENLGCTYTFLSFLEDPTVPRISKVLLQSIIKNPIMPDLESIEAEVYIEKKYCTVDFNSYLVAAEGIAISYIYNVPCLSLIDCPHWSRSALELQISSGTDTVIYEKVTNVTKSSSLEQKEFLDWYKSITEDAIMLKSKDDIERLYPIDKYSFDNQAIDDIISWYYDDKRFLVRIKNLINDINAHPFTGGIGKTETLAKSGGRSSKRIVGKDRIIYTYTQNMIYIHQCRGHYDDN